jgi:large subunit ribosomal protein L9
MKVILNHDVPNLGEIGDVKDVASGYARNYLLPRGLVYVYTPKSMQLFEKRKAEIEELKSKKRLASADVKTRIESCEMTLEMTAGKNGRLFGAVSNAMIAEELQKLGIQIDKKKIELPGRIIKSIGNYKVVIKLYEKNEAILQLSIKGKEEIKQTPVTEQPKRKRFGPKQEAEKQAEVQEENPKGEIRKSENEEIPAEESTT